MTTTLVPALLDADALDHLRVAWETGDDVGVLAAVRDLFDGRDGYLYALPEAPVIDERTPPCLGDLVRYDGTSRHSAWAPRRDVDSLVVREPGETGWTRLVRSDDGAEDTWNAPVTSLRVVARAVHRRVDE